MTHENISAAKVPLSQISVKPGFNPRRYFDPAKLAELTESVKASGVFQPILVRPRRDGMDGYWIVFGERRWRAANNAGLNEIPSLIRDLDDREALKLAVRENQDRADITPAEEAAIAQRTLDAFDGDDVAAAKALGWSKSKLRSRQMLMHALPEVLDAAAAQTIVLGHAELLSTLPNDVQKTVFERLLTHNISVDELRKQLATYTQDLSAAAFSTKECSGCEHNSSSQSSLFEYHVGEGRCSNRQCWGDKTKAFLAEARARLTAEFPMVFYDTEKDPALYTEVRADGERGVGDVQYAQGCKGCGRFGAVINTRPGKEGLVDSSVCFDTACNSEKRAAHAAMTAAAAAPAEAAATAAATSNKNQAKAAPAARPANPGMSSLPSKVTEQIDSFMRATAADAAAASPRLQKACEVYALRSLVGSHGQGATAGKKLAQILTMSDDGLAAESKKLVHSLISPGVGSTRFQGDQGEWAGAAARLLADAGTELSGRFVLTSDFLKAHTKAGIEAMLVSARFHESLDGEDADAKQKAFRKFMGQKHEDIVKAVMSSHHDFSTFVPPSVIERSKALRKG